MFDVSKSALKRIVEVSKKNKKKFFRISIDGGGCQGFSYKFDFDDKISENDKVLDYDEVKILPTSLLPYLYTLHWKSSNESVTSSFTDSSWNNIFQNIVFH